VAPSNQHEPDWRASEEAHEELASDEELSEEAHEELMAMP